MKNLIFTLLLFLPLTIFSQENFEYVTKATDNSKYYVKIVDTKINGNQVIIDIWLKIEKPTKQKKNKYGKLISVGGGKRLDFIKFYINDNGTNQYSKLKTIEYNSAGDITYENQEDEIFAEKEYVIPGSVMEGIEKYISENIG